MDTPADYQAHHAELIRAALAQVGPRFAGRVDASSIVQEVYLDLCRREPGAGAVSLPELRLRVRNKVTDFIRRLTAAKRGGGPAARLDQPDAVIDPPAAGPTPSQDASRREVVALLDELSEAEAAVVRAHYLDGRTYREIAAALNLPLGSVGLHLQNGLKKLRGRTLGEAT
jgi:RNA polymerase sigma factor (sigma-70 family)